jgi:hypothetical protein
MPDYQTGKKSFFGINFEEILKGRFDFPTLHPRLLAGFKTLMAVVVLATLFYNLFFV